MNQKTFLRGIEIAVIFLASFLSTRTLFSYFFLWAPLQGQGIGFFILTTAIIFLISIYFILYQGLLQVFYLNFIIALPEALSLSTMKWSLEMLRYEYFYPFNPLYSVDFLRTSRPSYEALATWLLLVAGYVTLYYITRYRSISGFMETRGEETDTVAYINRRSLMLYLTVMFASLMAVALLFLVADSLVEFFKIIPLPDGKQTLIGVSALMLLLSGILFGVRSRSPSSLAENDLNVKST